MTASSKVQDPGVPEVIVVVTLMSHLSSSIVVDPSAFVVFFVTLGEQSLSALQVLPGVAEPESFLHPPQGSSRITGNVVLSHVLYADDVELPSEMVEQLARNPRRVVLGFPTLHVVPSLVHSL